MVGLWEGTAHASVRRPDRGCIAQSVRAAVKLVYEYGKAIVTEKPLFQLRSDLVVFREFKVSIEKSVEQSTF